eukprot:1157745-Pelagomonas_calceolata.AAC.4
MLREGVPLGVLVLSPDGYPNQVNLVAHAASSPDPEAEREYNVVVGLAHPCCPGCNQLTSTSWRQDSSGLGVMEGF